MVPSTFSNPVATRPQSVTCRGSAPQEYPGCSKSYAKGKFIYLFGDQNRHTLVLEQGFVRLGIYTEEGEDMTTTVLKPGDLFGNFSARDTDDEEFAQTLTPVQIKVIDQTTFHQLLTTRPSFSQEFIDMISVRFLQLKSHFVMTTSMQAKKRIAIFLRFLADHCGYACAGTVVIDNFLTHQDIASITNTTRQTVTLRLIELQEEGLLRYSRKRIELLPAFHRYTAA